ncbi:MAG: hypothetical protein CMM93_07205 [Rickettsiales bacterium]|nr:hypothetical protein [Rickettsiales bacterium]|tara:strand:+ start:1029 stop:1955 length:927 start_codon:yes stop_codon:yes gene_type:complete
MEFFNRLYETVRSWFAGDSQHKTTNTDSNTHHTSTGSEFDAIRSIIEFEAPDRIDHIAAKKDFQYVQDKIKGHFHGIKNHYLASLEPTSYLQALKQFAQADLNHDKKIDGLPEKRQLMDALFAQAEKENGPEVREFLSRICEVEKNLDKDGRQKDGVIEGMMDDAITLLRHYVSCRAEAKVWDKKLAAAITANEDITSVTNAYKAQMQEVIVGFARPAVTKELKLFEGSFRMQAQQRVDLHREILSELNHVVDEVVNKTVSLLRDHPEIRKELTQLPEVTKETVQQIRQMSWTDFCDHQKEKSSSPVR